MVKRVDSGGTRNNKPSVSDVINDAANRVREAGQSIDHGLVRNQQSNSNQQNNQLQSNQQSNQAARANSEAELARIRAEQERIANENKRRADERARQQQAQNTQNKSLSSEPVSMGKVLLQEGQTAENLIAQQAQQEPGRVRQVEEEITPRRPTQPSGQITESTAPVENVQTQVEQTSPVNAPQVQQQAATQSQTQPAPLNATPEGIIYNEETGEFSEQPQTVRPATDVSPQDIVEEIAGQPSDLELDQDAILEEAFKRNYSTYRREGGTQPTPSDTSPTPQDNPQGENVSRETFDTVDTPETNETSVGDRTERDITRRRESITRIGEWLERGKFKSSGYDKKTGESPEVRSELDLTLEFFALRKSEEKYLWEALQYHYGYSPDKKNKIWKLQDAESAVLSDDLIIEGLRDLRRNTKRTGFPFGHRSKSKFGGVPRITIPIFRSKGPDSFVNVIANGRPGNNMKLNNVEFVQAGIDLWTNEIRQEFLTRTEFAQRQVLMDMLDAIEEYNGTSENYSNRAPDTDFTVHELFDEEDVWARTVSDPSIAVSDIQKMREMADDYAKEYFRSTHRIKKDKDGNYTATEIEQNGGQWVIENLIKVKKANRIVNPILGLAAGGEKVQGNITSKLSSLMLTKIYGAFKSRGNEAKVESITPGTRELVQTPEFRDAMKTVVAMYASGNRIGLQASLGDGVGIQSFKDPAFLETEGAQAKAEWVIDKYAAFAAKFATGDYILPNATSVRFIEYLQTALQSKDGNTLTAKQMENMLRQDPVGTLEKFLQTPEGNDAALFATDVTIDATNVGSEWITRQLKKSQVLNLITTTFVGNFPKYAHNVFGKIVPFAHTANYLTSYGIALNTENKTRQDALGMGVTNALNAQQEGGRVLNDKFWDGFAINFIQDAAWIGTRSVLFALVYGLYASLGVEPPDKDENKYNYLEWKIGGTAIGESWILRDMLGFVTPLVIANNAAQNGINPVSVFINGVENAIAGTPFLAVGDIVDGMLHWDRDYEEAQEDLIENWGDEAPDDWEYNKVKAQTWALGMIGDFFEPAIWQGLYTEGGWLSETNLEVSNSMIWDPVNEGETTRTTWDDSQFRSIARKHPLVAQMLNFVTGAGSDSNDLTGYSREERPLVEVTDAAGRYWMDRFWLDDDATTEEQEGVALDVIQLLGTFDSAEEAAACGVVIPYNARQQAFQYCYDIINGINDARTEDFATPYGWSANNKPLDQNGMTKDERYAQDRAAQAPYYEMINMLKSSAIPWSTSKYNQWQTDWRVRYSFKDSGEAATSLDYALDRARGGNNVEKEYYASGTHKSSFNPLQIVDNRFNTFDAQTPVSWFSDNYNNPEKMQELYGDVTIPEGQIGSGENLLDVLTGYGQADQYLTGQRALLPVKEDYSEQGSLKKEDDDGTGTSANYSSGSSGGGYSRRSYGGYSRSGGSGGGSSYSPNIYSKPAYSLNATKPATMYAKNPSYTRFDYLKPSYHKSGSRWASRRQEG